LSERLGSPRVLGGVTLFSVVLTPEGDISVPGIGPTGRTSIGELTGQRSARCDEICAAFVAGGVPATVSDDILAEMWAKFCGFAGGTAVSVLTRARAGESRRHIRRRGLCRRGARRNRSRHNRRGVSATGGDH